MSKLIVELYGNVLGTLSQDSNRFRFEADPTVFEKYALSSTIMSLAVPLNLQYTAVQKRRMDCFLCGEPLAYLSRRLVKRDAG
ncbi:MAG: hypothetical protein FWH28_02510 [Clostridiales bacterium]|nr:hypothetical protein [Clostridiales bacterium]